jgi:hypothetical protein
MGLPFVSQEKTGSQICFDYRRWVTRKKAEYQEEKFKCDLQLSKTAVGNKGKLVMW